MSASWPTVFERQTDGVLLRNHLFNGRIVNLGKYPALMDAEGFVGILPRLPNAVRSW